MFHILVVEDDQWVLHLLLKRLTEEVPESEINAAESVADGLPLIRRASERRWPYDAAILDFKLPHHQGENPEVDESLCRELVSSMPGTLCIHITAFPDDDKVREHLRIYHLEQLGPRGLVINKVSTDWPEDLLVQLKAYLYGSRIEKQMNRLFRLEDSLTSQRHGRDRLKGEGGVTHELASLCRDVAAYWYDLDGGLQKRIESLFYVKVGEDKNISVSLL